MHGQRPPVKASCRNVHSMFVAGSFVMVLVTFETD